jgi:hypothetical protein
MPRMIAPPHKSAIESIELFGANGLNLQLVN